MTGSADPRTPKDDLRRRIRAARRAMSPDEIDNSRRDVRAHVLARMDKDRDTGRPWRRVFAYEPMSDEPGSIGLLESMADRGASIYLPFVLPDKDLDWTQWPASTTLGRGAVADATVVLVPAFAVDHTGMRLGRGGGSYDRALARVGADATTVALLHSGELLTFVPTDPWDRPVSAVVTATGWFDVPRATPTPTP